MLCLSMVSLTRVLAANPTPEQIPSGAVITALGEVVLVEDLDLQFPTNLRMGWGGGLNQEMMFNEFVYKDLRRCMSEVESIALAWGDRQRLPVINSEIDDSRLLIHFYASAHGGFFEVTYRLYPDRRAVHAFFGFYDATLLPLAPESMAELISVYDLGTFIVELRTAASCRGNNKL
jgi:hypothetical protein